MITPPSKSKTRRIIRTTLAIALAVGLFSSLGASADWSVYDSRVEQQLKDVNKTIGSKGTVTGSLNNIQTIGQGDFNKDNQDGEKQGKYKKPPLEIKENAGAGQPSWDAPSLADLSEDTRCPAPSGASATDVATALGSMQGQQWRICKEIRDTERAQIKYNLMMSDLSGKRYDRLKEIQDERQNFRSETDAGLLQNNTNKMLALVALIQIDQQQQKAYNEAYQARLNYLRANQERLSQLAIHGTGPSMAGAGSDSLEYAGFASALGIATQFD